MNETVDHDLLIRNCRIMDGSGEPSFMGDVAVSGEKITAVGPNLDPNLKKAARKTIDAQGAAVCPGFIDVHTHDDLYLMLHPDGPAKVRQGVTTEVVGLCGLSAAPGAPEHWTELRALMGLLGAAHAGDRIGPMDFSEFLDRLEAAGPGINVAGLVGHSTIRLSVMGPDDRPPTADERDRMGALVRESMDQGAFGLSSGLIYPPGSYADTDELIALAAEAARYDGLYVSHIRGEGDGIDDSLGEALEIGERSGVRVLVSHLKVGGRNNWGRSRDILKMTANARDRGLSLWADQYPYTASSNYLSATLPPDVQTGGIESLCKRLADPASRDGLRRRIEGRAEPGWDNLVEAVGFSGVVITVSPSHPEWVGKSLAEIAEEDDADPPDVLFDLLIEDRAATGAVYHAMCEEDVIRIMAEPWIMIGSDGILAFSEQDKVHPRFYGTFPRVLGRYVREKGVLSPEAAVRKMTSLPAEVFGLKTKGYVRPGMDADLVIFDPETVRDRGGFTDPERPPEGIRRVLVGGRTAVEDNRVTGKGRGRVLRRGAL